MDKDKPAAQWQIAKVVCSIDNETKALRDLCAQGFEPFAIVMGVQESPTVAPNGQIMQVQQAVLWIWGKRQAPDTAKPDAAKTEAPAHGENGSEQRNIILAGA